MTAAPPRAVGRTARAGAALLALLLTGAARGEEPPFDRVLELEGGAVLTCAVHEEDADALVVSWALRPDARLRIPRERVVRLEGLRPTTASWALTTRRGDELRLDRPRIEGGVLTGVWTLRPDRLVTMPLAEVVSLRRLRVGPDEPPHALSLGDGARAWGRLLGLDEYVVELESPLLGRLTFRRDELRAARPDPGRPRAWTAPPRRRRVDLAQAWEDLASERPAARWRAFSALVRAGDPSVTELERRLAVAPGRLAALIDALDDEAWARRNAVSQRLVDLGRLAEGAVDAALEQASAEQRVRLAGIAARIAERRESVDEVALARRGLHALEQIGTPRALAVVRRVAAGDGLADAVQEARGILRRAERDDAPR